MVVAVATVTAASTGSPRDVRHGFGRGRDGKSFYGRRLHDKEKNESCDASKNTCILYTHTFSDSFDLMKEVLILSFFSMRDEIITKAIWMFATSRSAYCIL